MAIKIALKSLARRVLDPGYEISELAVCEGPVDLAGDDEDDFKSDLMS